MPPSPAVTRLPEVCAQVSTLLSNSAISSFSRCPAATSFLFAVNVEPGPPRMCALPRVTGSSSAQPAGPLRSLIVQVSPSRVRSMASFSAAYMSVAT